MIRKSIQIVLSFLVIAATSEALFVNHSIARTDNNLGESSLVKTTKSRRSLIPYTPPSNFKRRVQGNRGAGSRGCLTNETSKLTLLTPSDHVGLTSKKYPTLYFNLSKQTNRKVVFSLLEPGRPEPIFLKEVDAKQGINSVTLPENTPGLKPGKTYHWSVSIVCNSDRPDKDIYAEAEIERVTFNEALSQKLKATSTETDRSILLAQNGYWYDALDKAQKSESSANLTGDLLSQVGLNFTKNQ